MKVKYQRWFQQQKNNKKVLGCEHKRVISLALDQGAETNQIITLILLLQHRIHIQIINSSEINLINTNN